MERGSLSIQKIVLLVSSLMIVIPTLLLGQEKVKLSPEDMPDYLLIGETPFPWSMGPGYEYIMGIRQIWNAPGQELNIDYCEFQTEPEAVYKMFYFAPRSNSTIFIWGSIDGQRIIGDGTWIPAEKTSPNECLYFTRGNIGVKIDLHPDAADDGQKNLLSIIVKIMDKIEKNIPQGVKSFEQTIKLQQIPEASYGQITGSILDSDLMQNYSLKYTWDSKWPIDSTRCMMGRRHEWVDETGKSIGLDICRFFNSSDAKTAVETMGMSTMATDHLLNLENNLDSMSIIIDDWEKWGKKTNLSVIGYKKHVAFHLFKYDSSGIDTNTVRSLVELTARQIGNF